MADNAVLTRISDLAAHVFTTPVKKINDGDDLAFFHSSEGYRDLTIWIQQLNRSMFPTVEADGRVVPCTLDSYSDLPPAVTAVRTLLTHLSALVDQVPPVTGPRRFGNVAFRSWYQLAEEHAGTLLKDCLKVILPHDEATKYEVSQGMVDELLVYLLGSFGSAQRLDYGTGHELSFLAFVACLWKLNAFSNGIERSIVVGIVQPYLDLIRKVILTYTLEPAGSHGVWGLDDHSFVPYIFGSAQYGPAVSPDSPVPSEGSLDLAPAPSSVTNKTQVSHNKDLNMYMSAIQFIYDVKKGPFWEHSPILYDVSGIKDGWGKINKGMLKMYNAEVLGKFPVVQHFPFGSLFRWQRDPRAAIVQPTVHAQNQPQLSKSVPPPPASSAVGTKAPWAAATPPAMRNMSPATGLPTIRPTNAGVQRRPVAKNTRPGGTSPSTGDTASRHVPTVAPWARKS